MNVSMCPEVPFTVRHDRTPFTSLGRLVFDVLSPASGDAITPDRKALAVIIVEMSITCVSVWPLEMAVNKWCS